MGLTPEQFSEVEDTEGLVEGFFEAETYEEPVPSYADVEKMLQDQEADEPEEFEEEPEPVVRESDPAQYTAFDGQIAENKDRSSSCIGYVINQNDITQPCGGLSGHVYVYDNGKKPMAVARFRNKFPNIEDVRLALEALNAAIEGPWSQSYENSFEFMLYSISLPDLLLDEPACAPAVVTPGPVREVVHNSGDMESKINMECVNTDTAIWDAWFNVELDVEARPEHYNDIISKKEKIAQEKAGLEDKKKDINDQLKGKDRVNEELDKRLFRLLHEGVANRTVRARYLKKFPEGIKELWVLDEGEWILQDTFKLEPADAVQTEIPLAEPERKENNDRQSDEGVDVPTTSGEIQESTSTDTGAPEVPGEAESETDPNAKDTAEKEDLGTLVLSAINITDLGGGLVDEVYIADTEEPYAIAKFRKIRLPSEEQAAIRARLKGITGVSWVGDKVAPNLFHLTPDEGRKLLELINN